MQQDVVEGLERELQHFRECLAHVGCSASAWELGFVLECEAKVQAAKKVLLSVSRVRAEGSGVQHGASAYSQPRAKDVIGDGEVQHEAPAHMDGDESQLEAFAWPFCARRAGRLCGRGGRAAGGRQPAPVRHR